MRYRQGKVGGSPHSCKGGRGTLCSVAHLRLYASCRPVALSLMLAALKAHNGDTCRWYMAAPRGIVMAHPFLDPRLVQLGLGIKLRFRQEPGRQKPILAHALRDVLPAAIRDRRGKGHFNEIYYAGLARHLPTLETLIRRAPVEDLGWVDKGVLVECLRQAALGVDPSGFGVSQLEITLSLLAWLSLQEKGRGSPPAPVEVLHADQPNHQAIRAAHPGQMPAPTTA